MDSTTGSSCIYGGEWFLLYGHGHVGNRLGYFSISLVSTGNMDIPFIVVFQTAVVGKQIGDS